MQRPTLRAWMLVYGCAVGWGITIHVSECPQCVPQTTCCRLRIKVKNGVCQHNACAWSKPGSCTRVQYGIWCMWGSRGWGQLKRIRHRQCRERTQGATGVQPRSLQRKHHSPPCFNVRTVMHISCPSHDGNDQRPMPGMLCTESVRMLASAVHGNVCAASMHRSLATGPKGQVSDLRRESARPLRGSGCAGENRLFINPSLSGRHRRCMRGACGMLAQCETTRAAWDKASLPPTINPSHLPGTRTCGACCSGGRAGCPLARAGPWGRARAGTPRP